MTLKYKYPGLFRMNYPNLRGKDWVRRIDPDDKRVFVTIGLENNHHGRMGGKARSASALRDGRGRFMKSRS